MPFPVARLIRAFVEQLTCPLEVILAEGLRGEHDAVVVELFCKLALRLNGTYLFAFRVLLFLDGKLAKFKRPKQVSVLAALPRTGSGKIDKQALRKRYGGEA